VQTSVRSIQRLTCFDLLLPLSALGSHPPLYTHWIPSTIHHISVGSHPPASPSGARRDGTCGPALGAGCDAHGKRRCANRCIVEGGYDWTCGQFAAIPQYFKREDVRTALHLPNKNGKVSNPTVCVSIVLLSYYHTTYLAAVCGAVRRQ
jgi:hypothetical protein